MDVEDDDEMYLDYDRNNDGLIDSEYYPICYKLDFYGGKTEKTEPYDM